MEFTFDLTVDRQHIRDALKGLLSTIFFYRTFGSIVPETLEFLETPYPHVDVPEIDEDIEKQLDILIQRLDSELETPVLSCSSTTPFGSPGAHFNLNTITPTNPYANIKFDDPDQSTEASSLSNSRTMKASPALTPRDALQKEYKFAQIQLKFLERRKLKKPTWFGKIEEEVLWETWTLNVRVYRKAPDTDTNFIHSLNDNFADLVMKISDAANDNKDHIPIITSAEVMPFAYTINVTGKEGWKGFIKKMLSVDPLTA